MRPAAIWNAGDYAAAGDRWAQASADLALDLAAPGRAVLDLACGPGAFAIAAARAGARATGLDASPALLELARSRAAAAGVPVDWIEADMTAIPSPDDAFDTVASAFGCMFAPDPAAMAAEMVRVCRPGGTVAALAWTPESAFGRMGPLAADFLPSGPGASPVARWERPESVAELFARLPVDLVCTEHVVEVAWDGFDQAVYEISELNPAWLAVRAAVEPSGRWPELVGRLGGLFAAHGRHEGSRFVLPVPYLRSTAALR
ncbi:MAG TPA: class I SAM-dependent methyltransferase [Glycomyces sp.]|nr:class I SAM-dependent methyltransferase [Glycomyces sp.]